MNTEELLCCLGQIVKNSDIKKYSVLSADQIYQFSISTLKPRCCIVNTDESWKPGTHWVVFYWSNNNNE